MYFNYIILFRSKSCHPFSSIWSQDEGHNLTSRVVDGHTWLRARKSSLLGLLAFCNMIYIRKLPVMASYGILTASWDWPQAWLSFWLDPRPLHWMQTPLLLMKCRREYIVYVCRRISQGSGWLNLYLAKRKTASASTCNLITQKAIEVHERPPIVFLSDIVMYEMLNNSLTSMRD